MMPSALREARRVDYGRAGVIGALVIGQIFLLAYLLRLSVAQAMLLALGAGLPVTMLCYRLLARAGNKRCLRSLVVMFAAGGFGMLLGCIVDFGPLGLYELLGLCRSWASAEFWPGTTELWLMISLMPWACFGMLAFGNAGMMLFDALDHHRARSVTHLIGFYGVCNTGMLLGMMIAEHVVTRFSLGLGQEVAGALTVVAMLAGMTAGMTALLSLAARIPTFGRAFGV